MNTRDIAYRRMNNQLIALTPFVMPSDVVRWLGAIQAQDYLGALWAIGLRLSSATEVDIEEAIANRTIIRTWPMRGTLHFVAAGDVRWMLRLLTPRVIQRSAGRDRQLELDESVYARSREVFTAALQGGKQLTRDTMYRLLEEAQIATNGQRGIHILGRLAQEGLLCFGSRHGKQFTFTLLDEWVPEAKSLERDEALAELARRYFTSHGPASVQDLMWWSGLPSADVHAGLAQVAAELEREAIDGRIYWSAPRMSQIIEDANAIYLLPGFDEYLLGYQDRTAMISKVDQQRVQPGSNGMFSPTIVSDGRIAGTWRRTIKKAGIAVTPFPFGTLSESEQAAFTAVANRYAQFLGLPLIAG